jgi:hypothetical protein
LAGWRADCIEQALHARLMAWVAGGTLVEKQWPFRRRRRCLHAAGGHSAPDSERCDYRATDESDQAGIEYLIDQVPRDLVALNCIAAEHRVRPFVEEEGSLGSLLGRRVDGQADEQFTSRLAP